MEKNLLRAKKGLKIFLSRAQSEEVRVDNMLKEYLFRFLPESVPKKYGTGLLTRAHGKSTKTEPESRRQASASEQRATQRTRLFI
jgi:hypothetical protein